MQQSGRHKDNTHYIIAHSVRPSVCPHVFINASTSKYLLHDRFCKIKPLQRNNLVLYNVHVVVTEVMMSSCDHSDRTLMCSLYKFLLGHQYPMDRVCKL